ncbi:MAG: hypothetical protein NT004_03875 [Bacteroidetes bacterium]|nr:hypothetical protein [Bacteroidota bacterium]
MSIEYVSTETIGEKLRQLREGNGLPLRKVAAFPEIHYEKPGELVLKVAEDRIKYLTEMKK